MLVSHLTGEKWKFCECPYNIVDEYGKPVKRNFSKKEKNYTKNSKFK